MKKRTDSTDFLTHIFFYIHLVIESEWYEPILTPKYMECETGGRICKYAFSKRITFFLWQCYLNTYCCLSRFKLFFYEHPLHLCQWIYSRKNTRKEMLCLSFSPSFYEGESQAFVILPGKYNSYVIRGNCTP